MKTLISFFVIMMVMFVACNKDTFVQDEQPLTLKKASVPVPFQGSFCSIPQVPDPENPMPPGYSLIEGNGSHVGKLITEKSFMYYASPTRVAGVMTAANGDCMTWVHDFVMTPNADGTITVTGLVTITGGTGRFLDVFGTANPVGIFNPLTGVTCWTAEGTLEYPPKK
jgi:hypothetical protein